MGGQSSKIEDSLDPSSCEAKCRRITNRVINTSDGELSLESLKKLTSSFCETNQTVVEFFLLSKKYILNDKDLSDLVNDYFENSLHILNLYNVLQKCLKRARNSQMTIELAIKQFEREHREGNGKTKIYSSTLQELKKFKAAGDPFTNEQKQNEFCSLFEIIKEEQKSMSKKLDAMKTKRDKKGKIRKFCWFLSNAIFVASCVVEKICSIVGTMINSPSVMAAEMVAAAMQPLVYEWMEYENEWKRHTEIIDLLREKTQVSIRDLENIKAYVDKLKTMIESLMENADFAHGKEEAVMLAIDEMKKNLSQFTQTIEDLNKEVDHCFDKIMVGRKEIMDTIIIHRKKSHK